MDYKNLAPNVKRLAKKHGYKWTSFSIDKLNIKYHTFERSIKSGNISIKNVLKLCELFKVNIYQLCNEVEPENAQKMILATPLESGTVQKEIEQIEERKEIKEVSTVKTKSFDELNNLM